MNDREALQKVEQMAWDAVGKTHEEEDRTLVAIHNHCSKHLAGNDPRQEPIGTDSAYTIAKAAGGGNMAISCELVVELIEALRATKKPTGQIPDERVWNQIAGRDDKMYTEGWNDCRYAMIVSRLPAPGER